MLKNIRTADYEVISRQRTKLACGTFGWTGVYRAAYSIDRTVVGNSTDFIFVPRQYLQGAAGSSGERGYAKLVTASEIHLRCEVA